jgi:PAS domain S-box-containing protein
MKGFLLRNKTAFFLSLLYFVPGLLWVTFSDSWLFSNPVSSDAENIMRIDKIKDASFVVGVSVMIFFMIRLSRKKLVETHNQYQNLFDQHPQPMWIYDIKSLKFMAVNNAAVEQYGFSREEFTSMTLAGIRPADEVPLLNAYMANHKSGESGLGLWNHRKKSGAIIIAEIVANDVTFFGNACRLVCATDITEKIKKDADITRLSLVAKNATNSVIITDKEAKIEWVNEAFTALTGYTMKEVIGKRPSEFLHGELTDQSVRDEIFRCTAQKKPFTGEILNYRKDGTHFWLRLTVSPVISGGEITNFVTVQTDITAIKEQNNRLRDIAFTASHGFRKPLANILGLLELVHETGTERQVISNLKKSAMDLDSEIRVIVEKTTLVA